MPRPVSWLPRLYEIRRSVENSARTHFDRRSLQALFKLQPSAASSLMEMLPKVEIGRAHMVERQELLNFLDQAHAAEDVTALCIRQRAEKESVSRKAPRSLVLRDYEPIEPAALAPWIERGHLEVKFESVEQLADVLWRFACAMDGYGLEEFIRLYAPAKPASSELDLERADAQALKAEIEQMEADWVRIQAAKKIA